MQVLRVIDSLQLTAKYSVATPVNWQNGDKVMVTPNLSDDQATQKVRRHNCDTGLFISLFPKGHINGMAQMPFMLHANDAASLQFSKGFEKKDVPSGKGYIRLTPQPNVA